VLAGSDATTIALPSIIHKVVTNPVPYRKLQEIDDMDQKRLLFDPVKEVEVRKMPYL
jgi:hypothetical protein